MSDTESARPRVLLVDDEEGVRMSLRALLEGDYRIESVPSGEAAVQELPRFRPDVVLLDVRLLPSMSGLDALERIKAFDERIEVVMITAFASLLELLHEHDRLRERVESSERENERLRGVTYENEQLRNRLETSERQAEQLRQSMGELRAENDRHQKEREEAAERLNHLVNEIAQRLRPSAGVSRT